MLPKDLMDLMEALAKQLKGAPLRDFERKQMVAAFEKAEGSVFDRTRTAVRQILHAAPGFIDKKAEALNDVAHLLDDLKSCATAHSEKPGEMC